MAVASISSNYLNVLVKAKVALTDNVVALGLTSIKDESLPEFTAGSNIDVYLGSGDVRQYSLCNSPHDRHRYLVAVLKEKNSRGGSKFIHESIYQGQVLKIGRPRNNFELNNNAGKSILLAGGIGITPLLSMAYALSVESRPFQLHYCTREQKNVPFKELLVKSQFAENIFFHHDDMSDEQRLNMPQLLEQATDDAHLYVCGPTGFMEFVLSSARGAGWSEDRLHREYFSAEEPNRVDDVEFLVQLQKSGLTVAVSKTETLANALNRVGVGVPTSCEQGVCGTCIVNVISGEPDHRDMYLTSQEQSENKSMITCCSRSKSKMLTLDL